MVYPGIRSPGGIVTYHGYGVAGRGRAILSPTLASLLPTMSKWFRVARVWTSVRPSCDPFDFTVIGYETGLAAAERVRAPSARTS